MLFFIGDDQLNSWRNSVSFEVFFLFHEDIKYDSSGSVHEYNDKHIQIKRFIRITERGSKPGLQQQPKMQSSSHIQIDVFITS